MLASVASMIDLFNEDNINILLDYGYSVDVMANFEEGSITSAERVAQYNLTQQPVIEAFTFQQFHDFITQM